MSLPNAGIRRVRKANGFAWRNHDNPRLREHKSTAQFDGREIADILRPYSKFLLRRAETAHTFQEAEARLL
jgi:hypothetical protein